MTWIFSRGHILLSIQKESYVQAHSDTMVQQMCCRDQSHYTAANELHTSASSDRSYHLLGKIPWMAASQVCVAPHYRAITQKSSATDWRAPFSQGIDTTRLLYYVSLWCMHSAESWFSDGKFQNTASLRTCMCVRTHTPIIDARKSLNGSDGNHDITFHTAHLLIVLFVP